jgi:hypothetical protein
VLMQIMQSSNSDSGSGNAPLYGVGFGSSTVMILMALTIYYLKRQLKQLQVNYSTDCYVLFDHYTTRMKCTFLFAGAG